jgi:hypothetical protein
MFLSKLICPILSNKSMIKDRIKVRVSIVIGKRISALKLLEVNVIRTSFNSYQILIILVNYFSKEYGIKLCIVNWLICI